MSERLWQEVKRCSECSGTGIYNDYTDYGDQPCPKCDDGFIAVGKPKSDGVVWALLDAIPTPEIQQPRLQNIPTKKRNKSR